MSRRLIIGSTVSVATVASLVAITQGDLLARADIGSLMPSSFRARIELRTAGRSAAYQIEVWRSGEERLLVRFLEKTERGKYLIKQSGDYWLVAPRAKNPVKVGPSHRLYGGPTIDQILGTRVSANYEIVAVIDSNDDARGPIATFELKATSKVATYPRVQYVVRKDTARPLTARYAFATGKPALSSEFVQWSTSPVLHPSVVRLTDMIKNGAVTEVHITSMEVRPVPDALFDLRDSSARKQLESNPVQ